MKRNKAFTILELLVVVAIIAILAVIAIPNFIGRIDDARASQELAEINAVGKAIALYYAENGTYPTLQGKDGTLLQAQPVDGAPHNIDFSTLVPTYLATLPHFSYWWVDYMGDVYHTQNVIGSLSGNVFTPTTGYSYTLYKTNGTTQLLSAPYTLQTGEYIIGADAKGTELPKVGLSFKNAKMHPEDPEYVASIAVTGVALNKATTSIVQGSTETLLATVSPSNATNKSVTWTSSNTSVATVNSSGLVTGISAGSATITVTTVDGSKTATCTVTVTAVFTTATFTDAGATGMYGPSQSQLNTAYTSTTLAGKVTALSGMQLWTVPVTGKYRIDAYGASGGTGDGLASGSGARVIGDFNLVAGEQLLILVGQKGLNGIGSTSRAGGGGGGSFVTKGTSYTTAVPLLVASGGNGGSWQQHLNPGSAALGSTASDVAVAGHGRAGSGGGFTNNGTGSNYGNAFRNGGAGGLKETVGGDGGFGGGGGAQYEGGGGGGYRGGVPVAVNVYSAVGVGAYSYNIGTNTMYTNGANTGHGKVVITYVGP